MKRCLSVLLLAISALSASHQDQYRLSVTKVDPEFHCFALSNDLVLNIPEKNWEVQPLPKVGAEVYVKAYPRWVDSYKISGEFDIGFLKDPETKPFSAWITPESKTSNLTYVSSESICVEPAGWVFSAVYRDVILLSDGSRWIKEKDGHTVFATDARVFVSKQKEGDYLIVDLDEIGHSCKCKTLKGKTMTWRKFERVKPYTQM